MMKIFLDNRTLAGGLAAGEEPFDMALEVAGVVQVATALRSPRAEPHDRGNRTVELRFSVLRRHGSAGEATEFLLGHGAALTGLAGTATLYPESVAQRVFRCTSAVLRRVQGHQEGPTTTHVYGIVGGNLEPFEEEV
jgi:hypothetical protein